MGASRWDFCWRIPWLSIAVEPFSFPKDVKHEKIHECCSTGVTRSPHHFIVQDLEQQPTVITAALRSCQRWDSRANHPWITSFGSSHGWVYSSHGAVWIRSTVPQCFQLISSIIRMTLKLVTDLYPICTFWNIHWLFSTFSKKCNASSKAAAAENEKGFMIYLKISTCLLYLKKNKSSIMKSFSPTVFFFLFLQV